MSGSEKEGKGRKLYLQNRPGFGDLCLLSYVTHEKIMNFDDRNSFGCTSYAPITQTFFWD